MVKPILYRKSQKEPHLSQPNNYLQPSMTSSLNVLPSNKSKRGPTKQPKLSTEESLNS